MKTTNEEDKKEKKPSKAKRSPSLISEKIHQLEMELEEEMDASEDEAETVSVPDVMTKYKFAGKAVDESLEEIAKLCVVGASTKTLCDQGDELLLARIKPFFSKAKDAEGNKIARGLSFPTTISINEVLCNHSPFHDEDGVKLHGNDVVKIHIGCHIDGYPVSAAKTVLVEPLGGGLSCGDRPALKESAQNAIEAARCSLLAMIHSMRPGTLNAEVTDMIARIGHVFHSQAVEGVLSNRTKRWVPDGIDCIIGRRVIERVPQQDVGECEVGGNQVWNLDIAFTNSDLYRVSLGQEAGNLFRRTPEEYTLDPRVKQAGIALKEISEQAFCFPFHFKSLSNPLQSKMGIRVLCQKGVVEELPVLRVKPPHITARFSATIAITGKRIVVLCGLPSEAALFSSAPQLPEDLQEIINQPLDFATAAAQRRAGEAFASPKKRGRKE